MAVISTSADSPVDVSSRALILIGAEPITSFDDGNNEALVASNMYEDVARASLVNTRWRFATNQAVLNKLSDAPTGRHDSAYQIPSDSLMVHAVTVNDYPILYQSYGNKIFCDADSSDELILDYTFRVDEEFDNAEIAAKSNNPSDNAKVTVLDLKFDKSRIKLTKDEESKEDGFK